MPLESWDEVRTAWHVAQAGTVSGAAEALGVHHATVIRHIDALEQRLGVKLFQRHARGYTPTEAGQALAQVGRVTNEQFAQLGARLSGAGNGINGELTITTLAEIVPMLMPAVRKLAEAYPELIITLASDKRVMRLEYGEAHVAVRAGPRPSEPDNVVQQLVIQKMALFAAPSYIDRHGMPRSDEDLLEHRFLTRHPDNDRAPDILWLKANNLMDRSVLRTGEVSAILAAARAGMGLLFWADSDPDLGLVQVMPPRPEWSFALWLVTHVDLHRTPKVQAAVKAIKDTVQG